VVVFGLLCCFWDPFRFSFIVDTDSFRSLYVSMHISDEVCTCVVLIRHEVVCQEMDHM
jgi:hypothetical protein